MIEWFLARSLKNNGYILDQLRKCLSHVRRAGTATRTRGGTSGVSYILRFAHREVGQLVVYNSC